MKLNHFLYISSKFLKPFNYNSTLVLDASSKLPTGLLKGHLIELGAYDECVEDHENSTGVEIQGRHCMYELNATRQYIPLNPSLSICLPASCTDEDLENVLNSSINGSDEIKELGVTLIQAKCSSVESDEVDNKYLVLFG